MRSMTGFGSATREGPSGSVTCEVRSFNHRHLKVSLRAPAALSSREPELEARIRDALARGAVHASLRTGRPEEGVRPVVDLELARGYADALADLARQVGLPGEPDLRLIASLPGVILPGSADEEATETLARTAAEALEAALEQLRESREKEGAALRRDLDRRLDRVEKALGKVRKRVPKVVEAARTRLEKRLREVLQELPGEASRDAVAREVVLLAERADVSEEVTRLEAHLGAFREAAAAAGEVGRRLDFLLQEMLREVNTIGAKSQDAAVAAAVVDMKVEVDRMKEQAANIE